MKNRLLLLSATFCLASVASFILPARAVNFPDPATKDKIPDIPYVQAMIWKRLALADFVLTGTVRSGKSSYPIKLRTKGHQLVYEFQDQPLQIRVQLDPSAFTLEKRTSSTDKWTAVDAADMNKAILNTDITYEDLALNFFNWDDMQPMGLDNIKTLDAYVYEAKPGPKDQSRFAAVRFWVSKQYWAFLRIDGLNAQGQTIKRVEVQNVMTVAEKYVVFKEMKVATMAEDKNDIAKSTTYIDISDGQEGSGLK